MKGKLSSSPTKRIKATIKKMSKGYKGKSEFIYVDEYLTSQACSKCKTKTSTKTTTANNSKRKVHAVLKCDPCNKLWNRDVLASLNINYIFTYMSQNNNKRPPEFKKPTWLLYSSLKKDPLGTL
jgi:hypothetical protein